MSSHRAQSTGRRSQGQRRLQWQAQRRKRPSQVPSFQMALMVLCLSGLRDAIFRGLMVSTLLGLVVAAAASTEWCLRQRRRWSNSFDRGDVATIDICTAIITDATAAAAPAAATADGAGDPSPTCGDGLRQRR